MKERSLSRMFDQCTVEALHMRWRKRDIWKAGITIAGMLLLLVLMIWVPVSAAGAYEGMSGLATPGMGTVQATPTEDATVTALNKEKLVSDIRKENSDIFWSWTAMGTIIIGVAGVAITIFQFLRNRRDAQDKELRDRRNEREKRAEERFQKVVEGLGSDKPEARAGSAIMLRTFLQPGYEQFYQQSFDLAVVHLRLREVNPIEPIDSLSQALIRVFTESSELVREECEKLERPEYNKYLDASHVRLDRAYLARAPLQKVWFREAYLVGTDLHSAKLQEVDLIKADLSEANLDGADLLKVKLRESILSRAILRRANFMEADLYGVELTGANLEEADLRGANLEKTKPETTKSLKGTKMQKAHGLTKEQLELCRTKGAIIDEDSTTSSSQSIVLPPAPLQSSDVQAPSAPSAQGSIQPPDISESSTPSSQQGPGS